MFMLDSELIPFSKETSLFLKGSVFILEEMSILMTRNQNGYSKMEKEDPDEKKHRQAQFLIYKIMEQANNGNRSRRPSSLRIRIRKFKLRIGKRLKKLKKVMSMSFSTARTGIYKQFGQLRTCKSLFGPPKVETLTFPSLVS